MKTTTGTWVRLGLFIMLLLAGVVVLLVVDLPSIEQVRAWTAAGGVWGPLAFIGVYVLTTLLPLPKAVLSAAAGLAFGLLIGTTLVWIGAVLGAAASFWVGRLLGRDGVRKIAGGHLERLDALILKHGMVAILISRLVPVVPFTAVNYGSGLTAIGFPAYLLATGVGILPGTVAYVAVGAYGTDPTSWPFILAAVALVVLSVGGAWLARRRGNDDLETVADLELKD